MQSAPTFQPAASAPASAPARAAAQPGRRVTDAPTRMFHALFALSFTGAYLTADAEPWRALHVTLGYTLAGLLVFRVLYGLFGPRQAGLGQLWRKAGNAPAWLRGLAQAARSRSLQGINWGQGQYLLMVGAVVGLLLLALPLTLSGWGAYNEWGAFLGDDALAEVHEFIANAALALVLGHLAAIVGLSLLRRKNQALPMLSGRVAGPGPDLVKNNRAGLAVALLLAVLAFGAWQWQQYPSGLVPTPAGAGVQSDREHGDD